VGLELDDVEGGLELGHRLGLEKGRVEHLFAERKLLLENSLQLLRKQRMGYLRGGVLQLLKIFVAVFSC